MMTQPERNASYERIRRELGIDRMGTAPDAPLLPPRSRSAGIQRGASLPIEAEMHGVQMFEFGEVWARPGLDLRTRSIITVAVLTALNHMDQLYRHINCALNIGVTPDEVHEILLHVGNYAGLPKWENGVAVANEVFVARGILPAGSGVTVVPQPPMTHEERLAAMKRVTTAMNIGRIGQGAEAPVLQPLAGGVPSVTAAVNMPVASDMAQINGSHGFGELWGRPGLELRTRSFITFTVLQVLVQTHEITVHINIALNLGISPEAVYEALEQAGIYGGFSGWHNATLVAAHVFAQHKAVRGQRSAA